MPRRSKGPTLWLDKKRQQWVIRDKQRFVRTGIPAGDDAAAQEKLAEYIGEKFKPDRSKDPKIDVVLLVYLNEHAPTLARKENAVHTVGNLNKWWADKLVSEITAANCREYAKHRPQAAARRDLETLRAAVGYWHENYGPLSSIPKFKLPEKGRGRDRWLTRTEARQLRRSAMATPHLYRFIVIGLLTGSRTSSILNLKWKWIDFDRGLMLRREPTAAELKNKKYPTLRMGRALTRILRRWKKIDDGKSEYVCHYQGEKITRLRRSWGTALKASKLEGKISPHTLRHTRTTWLMQAGVDLWEAAGALGMSPRTLETTYGHHHPDYQKNAAEV